MSISFIAACLLSTSIGLIATLVVQHLLAPRVSSAESHQVWNYIVEQGIRPQMEVRFNQVNSNWPPKKVDMGLVMLEARSTAVAVERASAK